MDTSSCVILFLIDWRIGHPIEMPLFLKVHSVSTALEVSQSTPQKQFFFQPHQKENCWLLSQLLRLTS